jgi:hypothetical protein
MKEDYRSNDDIMVNSPFKRLAYGLGSMFLIIVVLILAIVIFVSFSKGPSFNRALAGHVITVVVLFLFWQATAEKNTVRSTWMAVFAGMGTWMVTGELAVHFGFAKIEGMEGLVLLFFLTAISIILWLRKIITWPVKVFLTSYLLNWWGHALLLGQIYLKEAYNMEIFGKSYFLSGVVCIMAFLGIVIYIAVKPIKKTRLIYLGLWLYALLVTGIEGITSITEKFYGH